MVNSFLDPVMGWLLYLHPALAVLVISFIVSILITLAIKLLTDQTLMKDLRDELKDLQKQMKELRTNPNKLAKMNKRFMETNMKYMSHSMRPTLYTFLPIILVFGWLNAHMFYPLAPGEPFEVTIEFAKEIDDSIQLNILEGLKQVEEPKIEKKKATWFLSGDAGKYPLEISYKDIIYEKEVLVSEDEKIYVQAEDSLKIPGTLFFSSSDENGASKIIVSNDKVRPFKNLPVVQDIPWVSGWSWLGAYILFSLIFSMTLRRALKIY